MSGEKTSAQLCRENGWGPGTVLEGSETWPDGTVFANRIVITAVGEAGVLARAIARRHGTDPWCSISRPEGGWSLRYRDWKAVAPALLGELAAEVERLRRENERLKRYWPESKEETLCRGAGGWFFRGAVLGIKPTKAEAVEMAVGYLSASPTPDDNPWPGHPVIEPDPAEAALAEERARIEALAREEEAMAKEEGLREQFEAAVELLDRRGNGSLAELGVTREQWNTYIRTREVPEGWEPPAGLQGEEG